MTDDKNGFGITNRDRILHAWISSTELVRDYGAYSRDMREDKELCKLFAEYAEKEAIRAAELLDMLKRMQ